MVIKTYIRIFVITAVRWLKQKHITNTTSLTNKQNHSWYVAAMLAFRSPTIHSTYKTNLKMELYITELKIEDILTPDMKTNTYLLQVIRM